MILVFFRRKSKVTDGICAIARKSKIPLGFIKNPVHYEMNSNKEIAIEGCKGILHYEESAVKLNMQNTVTVIYGQKLNIKCLTEDSLIVTGFINSIEFEH